MTASLYRRCGCRTADGRLYTPLADRPTDTQRERACPAMADSAHGRWTFRLSAEGRQVSGGTYASRRDAAQARAAAEGRAAAGKAPSPSRVTLGEYLPRWLDRAAALGTSRTRRPLAPATLAVYRRYAEQHLVPALGRVQLRELRRRHVQQFVDDLAAQHGAATVRGVVAVLQGCLSSAVRDELISESPARDLDLPAATAAPFEPWTPEQVGAFLAVAGRHRLGALFEVAVWTGLRRGELLALRWADVDLAARELRVRWGKTGARWVPLSEAAATALARWRTEQERGTGYVFTMSDGRPLRPQYATRLFDRLREQAGLPDMTLHGLRHMAASLLLASGADVEYVSKVLGHSNVRVTSGIYSHLLRGAGQAQADRAAALVRSGSGSAVGVGLAVVAL